MAQDDFGNEVLLDEQTKEEYELQWCLAEADSRRYCIVLRKSYIEKHGIEKFLSELRKRLEQ